jgi:hypothetical protein
MKLVKSKWNRLFLYPVQAPAGLFVCIQWNRDYQEWIVWPSWDCNATYHTTDAADAVSTADAMATKHRDSAAAEAL